MEREENRSVRARGVRHCAIAVCAAWWLLGCSIEDRSLQERKADSGIERGQDGGVDARRDGSVARPGAGRDGGTSTGPGGGTGGSGQPCTPPCADPTPPTCSDCAPARVSGALIGVSGAPRAPAGLRLREHGFEPTARVCESVRGRVMCVSGGIGP